jgi:hypothetical protein
MSEDSLWKDIADAWLESQRTLSKCCNSQVWWTSYNRESFTGWPEHDHHTCQQCKKPCEIHEIEDDIEDEEIEE